MKFAPWSAMILALAAACSVHAADAPQGAAAKAELREKWESMTPEQKASARAAAKEKWDSMTPEQQAAAKQRFSERHPRAAARAAESAKAASQP